MIRMILLMLSASIAQADTIVATRTLAPQTVIGPQDLARSEQTLAGGISNPDLIIGMETRVALYAGRPITPADVGPPATVDRNEIVPLIYKEGGLTITTEGRALARGGPGDVIRVMNIVSRSTVSARIASDGFAYVSN